MKYIILFFIVVMLTAYPTGWPDIDEYSVSYFIKNSSSQDLYVVKCNKLNRTNANIPKDSTIKIIDKASDDTDFCVSDYNYYSDTLFVYASDSTTLLKVWISSDSAVIGKQFYRGNDWLHEQYDSHIKDFKAIHEWTFEITDDDLQ